MNEPIADKSTPAREFSDLVAHGFIKHIHIPRIGYYGHVFLPLSRTHNMPSNDRCGRQNREPAKRLGAIVGDRSVGSDERIEFEICYSG